MFNRTEELEKGINVMNALEDGKFPLMLSRIAQFLSNDTSSKPFTDAEEQKLEISLEITRHEVQLLIDTTIEIFNKCIYHMIKPSSLAEELEKKLGVNPEKAEAFVQAWSKFAKGIIDNFKQKSFLPMLSHISYTISIETASATESGQKLAKAHLQLGLSNVKQREDVNIEFKHDELYNFYRRLEQVQDQLDALR